MHSDITAGDIVAIAVPGTGDKRVDGRLKYTRIPVSPPLIVISSSGSGPTASIECLAPTGDVLSLRSLGVMRMGRCAR